MAGPISWSVLGTNVAASCGPRGGTRTFPAGDVLEITTRLVIPVWMEERGGRLKYPDP